MSEASEAAEAGGRKVCGKCGEPEPRSNFPRNARKPDGLNNFCKPCVNAAKQRYRKHGPIGTATGIGSGTLGARRMEKAAGRGKKHCEYCGCKLAWDNSGQYCGAHSTAAKRRRPA